MSRQSEAVKRWRKNTKTKIVDILGGKCCVCGYNKCDSALALHHLEPNEKEISFGKMRACPKNWEQIKKELMKCVLVCHNCHSEIHSGLLKVNIEMQNLDKDLFDKKKLFKKDDLDQCPICGKDKPKHLITCSLECARKKSWKIDWSKIDLVEELKTKNINQIADELGCSWTNIKKKLRRLNSPVVQR